MEYSSTRKSGNNRYKKGNIVQRQSNENISRKQGNNNSNTQNIRNSHYENHNRTKSRIKDRSLDRISNANVIDAKKFIQIKKGEIKQRMVKTPDRNWNKSTNKTNNNANTGANLRKGVVKSTYEYHSKNTNVSDKNIKKNLSDEKLVSRGNNIKTATNSSSTHSRYQNQNQNQNQQSNNKNINRSKDYEKKNNNHLNKSRHYSRSPDMSRKNDMWTTSNISQDNNYWNSSNNSYTKYASHSHCSDNTQSQGYNTKWSNNKFHKVLDNIDNEINSIYNKNVEQKKDTYYNPIDIKYSNNYSQIANNAKNPQWYYNNNSYCASGTNKSPSSDNSNINSCNLSTYQAQLYDKRNIEKSNNITAMSSQINNGQRYNYNNYIVSNNSTKVHEHSVIPIQGSPIFKKIPTPTSISKNNSNKTHSPWLDKSSSFIEENEKLYHMHSTNMNSNSNNKDTKDSSHSPNHNNNNFFSHSPSQYTSSHQYNSTNSVLNISRGNRDTNSIGNHSNHTYSNNFEESRLSGNMKTIEEMHLGFVCMIQRSRQWMSIQENGEVRDKTNPRLLMDNIRGYHNDYNNSMKPEEPFTGSSVIYVEERDIF